MSTNEASMASNETKVGNRDGSGRDHKHAVVGHAVSHTVPVFPDEIFPYTYQYAVADDYSGSRFDAQESEDGTAARQGHYPMNLPDGRIQHVNYHANDIDGYVAEVTYDGTAAFPTAVVGVRHGIAHGGVVGHGIARSGVVGHGVGIAHGGVAHVG